MKKSSRNKIISYLLLSCMLTGTLSSSQNDAIEETLQFEIMPFDYADDDMKEELCLMIMNDQEMADRLHNTAKEALEFLSEPDAQYNISCFVCQTTNQPSTICGFIQCAQYDAYYCSLHPQTGFWFSPMPQTEKEYELIKSIPSVGYIGQLAVHKNYRGKGIAQGMLHFFQENCNQNGIKTLMLFVDADNDAAINAYRKFGLEIDRQLNDNVVNYTMIKSIA